jgi:membrane fusion protein (multidrug efflux system)
MTVRPALTTLAFGSLRAPLRGACGRGGGRPPTAPRAFSRARLGLTALSALALLALVGCSRGKEEKALSAPPVTVADVVTVELEDRIEASGELVSPSHATIAAEIGGRITALYLEEGSPAAKGARVVEIDPERRNLEVKAARAGDAEARAALTESSRAAARTRQLFGSNVASQAQVDAADTALELARSRADAAAARLGEAERAQRDAEVTAPFAGLVAQRWVSVGEFVQPGTRLFELVALDPLEVEFRVAEVDSSRVATGQGIGVRVAPFPDEVFAATVTVVSPTIDPATRTLRVKGQLANPDGRLRPGLFARADLGIAKRAGVLMVPEEAVLQRADGKVVFRYKNDGRVERRVIAIGAQKDGRLEVLSGLDARDKIVVRGHTALVDGAVVSVRATDGGVLEPDIASGKSSGPAKAE